MGGAGKGTQIVKKIQSFLFFFNFEDSIIVFLFFIFYLWWLSSEKM